MKQPFLETGQIVNTHGVRGEVKVVPWADAPEDLLRFRTFYLDGKPLNALSVRVDKRNVLICFEGVDTVEAAMKLKGKTLSVARADAKLPQGWHFLADLVGLEVLDAATGEKLGVLEEVLTLPAQNVYVVSGGARRYMIPAVPAFIAETNVDEGFIKVNVIEGMGE